MGVTRCNLPGEARLDVGHPHDVAGALLTCPCIHRPAAPDVLVSLPLRAGQAELKLADNLLPRGANRDNGPALEHRPWCHRGVARFIPCLPQKAREQSSAEWPHRLPREVPRTAHDVFAVEGGHGVAQS